MSISSKVKSISDKWFSQKSKAEPSKGECDKELIDEENGLFIRRNSLIQLKCKRGGSESIKYYLIPDFFSKYTNKWVITKENTLLWSQEGKMAKIHVLTVVEADVEA